MKTEGRRSLDKGKERHGGMGPVGRRGAVIMMRRQRSRRRAVRSLMLAFLSPPQTPRSKRRRADHRVGQSEPQGTTHLETLSTLHFHLWAAYSCRQAAAGYRAQAAQAAQAAHRRSGVNWQCQLQITACDPEV